MASDLLLPNDLAGCQALIAEMAKTVAAQEQTITTLMQKSLEQQLRIVELLRLAFQKQRERYLDDPSQLKLDFGEGVSDAADRLADAVEDAKQATQEIAAHTRRTSRPKKPRNEQLPAHLERRNVTAEVPEAMRFCPTHGERRIIGYDYQEKLIFEQPQLWVERLAIPKFACPDSPVCGIVAPPRPVGLVEGNRYDTSVAAQIITMKTGFHLPIYREQDLFAGSGWAPQRSTLLNISAAAGNLLPGFIAYLRMVVLRCGLIGTDDTRVTLLLPKRHRENSPRFPGNSRLKTSCGIEQETSQ